MGLKSNKELFIDTDVIAAHLEGTSELLLNATSSFTCYTSVINAGEILSAVTGKDHIKKAKEAFMGLNILGIPFRYADTISVIMRKTRKPDLRISLIATMCFETNMPLLTLHEKNYELLRRKFGLKIVSEKSFQKFKENFKL